MFRSGNESVAWASVLSLENQSGIKDNSAVSREIVEAYDRRIGFSSQPGVGSLFWFELRAV